MTQSHYYSLQERAMFFNELVETRGWQLLTQTFRPEIRVRISDQDDKAAFMYEAIRSQVIQEIFSTPHLIMQQAERSNN